jgi:hypothetical protein
MLYYARMPPGGLAGGLQANKINALAVSVLRLFEPTVPTTLGEFFLHWVKFFLV